MVKEDEDAEWHVVEVESEFDNEYELVERKDWREEGDSVKGEVVDIFEADYGNGYLIEKNENEAVIVYDSPHILQKAMVNIEVGHTVKITYVDTIKTNNEYDMKDFEVKWR